MLDRVKDPVWLFLCGKSQEVKISTYIQYKLKENINVLLYAN